MIYSLRFGLKQEHRAGKGWMSVPFIPLPLPHRARRLGLIIGQGERISYPGAPAETRNAMWWNFSSDLCPCSFWRASASPQGRANTGSSALLRTRTSCRTLAPSLEVFSAKPDRAALPMRFKVSFKILSIPSHPRTLLLCCAGGRAGKQGFCEPCCASMSL